MPRSLADGKTKYTILLEPPADPAAPTVEELEAGIDASCEVLASDFTWGATDSDKVQEKALCDENNANALGPSNYEAGVTAFRYFLAETPGEPELIEPANSAPDDSSFEALKGKGVTFWGYARKTSKKSTDPWEDGDEIYLGAEAITDETQPPSDLGGYIKWRHPMEIQRAYPWISVGAASGS